MTNSHKKTFSAYYGIYLYGLATDNDQVRDLGRILLVRKDRKPSKINPYTCTIRFDT